MTYKIFIIALLSVFLTGIAYGNDDDGNLYTWKDEQGVLNITDQSPPDGAEIIDIRPSYRKAAEELQGQRLIRQEKTSQNQEREIIEQQATLARKEEAEAIQTAEELKFQAESIRQTKRFSSRKMRKSRRRAARYETKAEKALKQAEKAGKRAEIFERMLEN